MDYCEENVVEDERKEQISIIANVFWTPAKDEIKKTDIEK